MLVGYKIRGWMEKKVIVMNVLSDHEAAMRARIFSDKQTLSFVATPLRVMLRHWCHRHEGTQEFDSTVLAFYI